MEKEQSEELMREEKKVDKVLLITCFRSFFIFGVVQRTESERERKKNKRMHIHL